MKITFDKKNYRKHSEQNKKRIRKSLTECGAGRSVLVDKDGCLIAGNGVYEQAEKMGIKTRVVETDGTELVVVKRTDIGTDDQKRKTLSSVGLASVPSWLKSYHVLSNGEKMRCDLARAILSKEKLFVFDEFTSVVDRNVAKIGSFAMQKAIRKTDKQFIAVTCHYDVEDWLLPDWVFDTNTMAFRVCEEQKKKKIDQNASCEFTKQKEKNIIGQCLENIII